MQKRFESHVLGSTRCQHETCVGFSHLFLKKLSVCQEELNRPQCELSRMGMVRMKVRLAVNEHDLLLTLLFVCWSPAPPCTLQHSADECVISMSEVSPSPAGAAAVS